MGLKNEKVLTSLSDGSVLGVFERGIQGNNYIIYMLLKHIDPLNGHNWQHSGQMSQHIKILKKTIKIQPVMPTKVCGKVRKILKVC